jgi:DHA1 family tetracycline resistance protein-like MFS transporter
LFAERRFTWHGKPFEAVQVGYALAFLGLSGVIIQGGLIRHLVKRLGEARLVPAGFISMVVGLALLGVVHTVPQLLLVMAIFSFGSSVIRPALATLITQGVGRKRQGMGIGMTQSVMSVAQIIAPAIGGMLIQRQMLASWAFAGALCALVGLLWCLRGRVPTTYASEDASIGD